MRTRLEITQARLEVLREDCGMVEARLFALAIEAIDPGLTEAELLERQTLQQMHAQLVHETIDALAELYYLSEGARA